MPYPGSTTYPGAATYPGVPAATPPVVTPPVVTTPVAVVPPYPGGPMQQQIALGVGVGGALVDVSSYVKGPEGVTYSWGRQDEFRDPAAGVISFTLENQDGRFTPGNTASPLPTLLTEGTAVVWSCAGRLVQMQVIAIGFASSEDQWGRIQVQCADALNIANRTTLQDLAASAAQAGAFFWWPLTEAAGSAQALEQSGHNGPPVMALLNAVGLLTTSTTFGQASSTASSDTQVLVSPNVPAGSGDVGQFFGTATGTFPAVSYPTGSLGAWGFWWTPRTVESITFTLNVGSVSTSGQFTGQSLGWTLQGSLINGWTANGSTNVFQTRGGTHYLAFTTSYSGTVATTTFYCDGVSIGSQTWTLPASLQPVGFNFTNTMTTVNAIGDMALVSHISHTPALVHEEAAAVTSEAARFVLLASTVPQIKVGTIDPNLSPAPVDKQNTAGTSAFTALSDLLRTEQGHYYFTTSGTLTAPSTVLNFRSRVRSPTVAQSFDAQAEILDVPQFVRDITNMYSTITATGPNVSATVVDRAAIPRVGSAYVSETVIFAKQTDLTTYATDRLLRGENVNLRIASLQIDTVTVASSQQAATVAKILALLPGDRIRVTNLPATGLGFTSWDGWFIGGAEQHQFNSDSFTLYVAPVLPPTGVFNTDLFADGGTIALNGAVTATASQLTVTSSDGVTLFETGQVPYTVQVDSEQMTVTAASGAYSGAQQTLTVTRGVNGTTAAAHAVGAVPEVVDASNIFAY